MTKPIRVLVIGAGKMGRNHLRVLRANPRFEVVGVVDPDEQAGTEAIRGGGIYHARRPPMRGGYDAVIIATPSEYHHDTLMDCALVPILVEKPLAISYDAASNMVENDGHSTVVGHIERFNPAVRRLRALIQSGRFGDVRYVDTIRAGSPPAAPGVNIVFDLAVHDIDICRWLFGPMRLRSAVCKEQSAGLVLHTPSIATINITVNWTDPSKRRTLYVEGSRARALLDYQNQTLTVNDAPIEIERDEPLRAELDAFATFIQTGDRGDLCSAQDGAAAVRLCEMAVQHDTGWI